MATGRKTGGRRKGTRNRVTAEIKVAFRLHGDELVDALLALDRGWDKAVQAVDLGVEVQITSIERRIIDPQVLEIEGGGARPGPALSLCVPRLPLNLKFLKIAASR